jgi:transposase InsO family protein
LGGLSEQSRAARRQPNAISAQVEAWLLRARSLFPSWGPKKLVVWAQRESGLGTLCALSTAGEILRRHGLTTPRKCTRKGEVFAGLLVDATAVNELWCVDFKGHFKVGDRSRCDPLTMTDACTRFLLKCPGYAQHGLGGGPPGF